MAKSVLKRLTPQDLLKIKDVVAYDPTVPNGLRWLVKRRGRKASGVGQTFWIGQSSYQASHIVMILDDKWPADGDSVVTRIDKAGPWGDVRNLTWAPMGDALAGGRDHNRQQLLRSVFGDNIPDLGGRLRLTSLCKRGHQWNGYPVSLQSKEGASWRCKECERQQKSSPEAVAARQARYETNREKFCREAKERAAIRKADPVLAEADRQKQLTPERAEKRRIHKAKIAAELRQKGLTHRGTIPMRADGAVPKGQINEAVAEAAAQQRALEQALRPGRRSPTVFQLLVESQRLYWRENPSAKRQLANDLSKARWQIRYQSDPDFRLYHREKSKRRKAQARRQSPSRVPISAIRQRFDEFGNCCAYCGHVGDMQIEHVEPICEGGLHNIGNIVPACWPCNSSKRANEMESWYRQQPFFSELRLARIRKATHRPDDNQLALALA